jgi:hypothetical protein
MRIGLVSDTHLPRFGKDLPAVLEQGPYCAAELILHLGDFRSLAVADMFRRIARFDAVAGNNDVLRMQVRLVYQIGKACS